MIFLSPGKKYHWTFHARDKMRFYGLSESRVKRVLNSPMRVEEGVAPNTVAAMQPNVSMGTKGNEKWKQEIWVMTQTARKTPKGGSSVVKIISAWRYPGVSKLRGAALREAMQKEYRDFTVAGR